MNSAGRRRLHRAPVTHQKLDAAAQRQVRRAFAARCTSWVQARLYRHPKALPPCASGTMRCMLLAQDSVGAQGHPPALHPPGIASRMARGPGKASPRAPDQRAADQAAANQRAARWPAACHCLKNRLDTPKDRAGTGFLCWPRRPCRRCIAGVHPHAQAAGTLATAGAWRAGMGKRRGARVLATAGRPLSRLRAWLRQRRQPAARACHKVDKGGGACSQGF